MSDGDFGLQSLRNTSGQGQSAYVPPEVKSGWNWGAFSLTWIWAIGNNTWIGLVALVPAAELVMAIVLGIKGNEWAWQNRRFESVQQFREVQAAWSAWGILILILKLLAWSGILLVYLGFMQHFYMNQYNNLVR